jgi:hypothetical protein
LTLIGLVVLGWLALTFMPGQVRLPANALDGHPVEAIIYGLLVAVAVVPVSAALVFLAVLVWGWFPGGLVMFTFLFGLFGLVWLASPIVTGLWVGRAVTAAAGGVRGDLVNLLIGIVLIVVVARVLSWVPCVGVLAALGVYLLSFALAVGGWILARRPAAQAPMPTTQPPAATPEAV